MIATRAAATLMATLVACGRSDARVQPSASAARDVAPQDTPPPACSSRSTSIWITPQTVALEAGRTVTLAAHVAMCPTAGDTGVTWTPVDSTIATVRPDGVVTARRVGTTVVFAAANALPMLRAAVPVTVRADASRAR